MPFSLEQIQAEWEKDSFIDKDNPAPLSVDQLHDKYWRYLASSRLELIPLNEEIAILKVEKERYFLHPTKETATATKWVYPAANKILKTEVKGYLAADKDIIDIQRKISILEIRIEFIEDILKRIHNRSYLINAHIDSMKFKNGIS